MTEQSGTWSIYVCEVCWARPSSLMVCKCVACGAPHSLCAGCLTAMSGMGMARERVEERVEESDLFPRRVITFNVHDLLMCPRHVEVRTAALLGKG